MKKGYLLNFGVLKNTYIFVEIIACLLIILFIYTGLTKLLEYDTFKFQLGRSPFLQNFATLIASTLPTAELLIAATLISRKTRLIGLQASFFLMLLFTGYIWIMLHYSYYIPCSCGGILASLSWNDHLVFNTIFTILSFIGILLQATHIKRQQGKNRQIDLITSMVKNHST